MELKWQMIALTQRELKAHQSLKVQQEGMLVVQISLPPPGFGGISRAHVKQNGIHQRYRSISGMFDTLRLASVFPAAMETMV